MIRTWSRKTEATSFFPDGTERMRSIGRRFSLDGTERMHSIRCRLVRRDDGCCTFLLARGRNATEGRGRSESFHPRSALTLVLASWLVGRARRRNRDVGSRRARNSSGSWRWHGEMVESGSHRRRPHRSRNLVESCDRKRLAVRAGKERLLVWGRCESSAWYLVSLRT